MNNVHQPAESYSKMYGTELRYTVLLKSKLPVSSRFSRDESRISWYEILVLRDTTLVSRYENLVLRESVKQKFWNITELKLLAKNTCLVMRLSVSFLNGQCQQWVIPAYMYVHIVRADVIRNNFVFIQFKGFDSRTM